ncbi:MAG: segregation/condensation protein A [Methanomassiliicoccales archaeon]|jgi:segregation and condensation protein A|nr:segregation/condensation protein A [Methanomassiliicoccales archaeon]
MTTCENAASILDHLLFHKAIIDDGDRARRIDHYLELLHQAESQTQPITMNPLDRAIQLVFELVISNNLDPWDIDLVQFTKLYTEKMQDEEINFIVAGKLMFMAWMILRLQSEKVLEMHRRAEAYDLFCSDWDFDHLDMLTNSTDSVPFECDILDHVELAEAIRRGSSRPVSLVELLDAFDEARKEAEANLRRAAIREEMKKAGIKFDEKTHPEDVEKDVEIVWQRIQRCGPGVISIEDLWEESKEDRVMVFVSLLFLAKMGKISLTQDDLPYGQIFVEARVPWDIGAIEDAATPETTYSNGEAVM